VLFSPLVGSTDSRRQDLNQLWSELQVKTRQVEPLTNLPDKVHTANRQIADFYKKRFPRRIRKSPPNSASWPRPMGSPSSRRGIP
jgi:hypothetical protein